jgi:hypothetical protein
MDQLTFRGRIARLMQRSRKALRLYSSLGKEGANPHAEAQAQEWKAVNSELLRQLSLLIDLSSPKQLSRDLFLLRDRFLTDWRSSEAILVQKQKELVFSSENGDFVKAALLSSELVVLKARVQACQAAHHELEDVLKSVRLVTEVSPIKLEASQVVEETETSSHKVIPLRRRMGR